MAITIANARVGFTNAYLGGTDLGGLGPIKIRFTKQGTELTYGQTGVIVINEIDIGSRVTVEIELREISPASFSAALGADLVGNSLAFRSEVGTSLATGAQELILKAIIDGIESADTIEWWTFPLAKVGSGADIELDFNNPTEQQRIKATFKILPEQQVDGSFLFAYKGDAPA